MTKKSSLTAEQVLQRYKDEHLLDFAEMSLADVNQVGNFGDMPLHIAAVRGELDEANALLDAGADVNAKGEQGYTPLHNAAIKGSIPVIIQLLNSGAVIDTRNAFGTTARDVALGEGHNDAVSAIDDWRKRNK